MPACSGRQENILLHHMLQQKADNIKLITIDRHLSCEETGVNPAFKQHWIHYQGDVFKRILTLEDEMSSCVWFDMTGGLTDTNASGIHDCVYQKIGDDSLVFVTLTISGSIRGMTEHNSHMLQRYNRSSLSREDLTEQALKKLCSPKGKNAHSIMKPYIYSRARSTFGVFGYLIEKI